MQGSSFWLHIFLVIVTKPGPTVDPWRLNTSLLRLLYASLRQVKVERTKTSLAEYNGISMAGLVYPYTCNSSRCSYSKNLKYILSSDRLLKKVILREIQLDYRNYHDFDKWPAALENQSSGVSDHARLKPDKAACEQQRR